MSLMKCPDCGAAVSSRAAQCPHCSCPQSAFVENLPADSSAGDNVTPPPPVPNKPGGGNKKILILLVIALAVALVVVLITLAGSDDKPAKKSDMELLLEAIEKEEQEMLALGLGRDGCYEVGDYYNRDGKEGVVFYITNGGYNGKIVSLNETTVDWDDAKRWCRNQGSGWYLPSKEELLKIYDKKDRIRTTLEHVGATTITGYYWSSTEEDEFCAWRVHLGHGGTGINFKFSSNCVRAVSAF